MRAYSMDLRVRAVRDLDAGMMPDAVAEQYHVSGSGYACSASGVGRPARSRPARSGMGRDAHSNRISIRWRRSSQSSPIARWPSCARWWAGIVKAKSA